MKGLYYVLLMIVICLFAFTLYGFLEGPSYGRDDVILWGVWAIVSLALTIVMLVCRKKIFAMKPSKGAFLMLALVGAMCLVADAVYVLQKVTSTVITSCKINQSLIFLALLCVTAVFIFLIKRK